MRRRRLQAARSAPSANGGKAAAGAAIVDRKGFIKSIQEGFQAAVRGEWPEFDAASLPNPLAQSLLHGATGHYRGKRVALTAQRVGDLYFVLASSLPPFERLTRREREIVQRFASGFTYKEIAREIGLAPATVRNHLQAAYAKLGVRDKGALATLLAAENNR